jgi:hypothetical protein
LRARARAPKGNADRRTAFSWTSVATLLLIPPATRQTDRRARRLTFPGIEFDDRRNAAHAAVISCEASRVAVRVIPTDEQLMIARPVCRLLVTARDDASVGTRALREIRRAARTAIGGFRRNLVR